MVKSAAFIKDMYTSDLIAFMDRCKEENRVKRKRSRDLFKRNLNEILRYIDMICDSDIQKYEVQLTAGIFHYSNDTVVVFARRLAENFGISVSFVNNEFRHLGYIKVDKNEKDVIIRKTIRDSSMLNVWTVRRFVSKKEKKSTNIN